MTDREREARIRDRGTTHWEGCWRSHPRCAEARVEKLEARVERYREALEKIVNEDVGTVGDGSPQEVLIATQRVAHRALNDGEDDG